MGGADPSSGTASIHEVIRGLGHLLRRGWTPLRTIVIASWDAEEYGLIGSTEWGEDFADWIDEHVVAYLNLGRLLLPRMFMHLLISSLRRCRVRVPLQRLGNAVTRPPLARRRRGHRTSYKT